MGQITKNMDKIRELFYEYPDKPFTIREIAKKTNIPKSTVQKYLQEIKREMKDSELFKIEKIHFYIEKIFETGLIRYLEDTLRSSCIILFGSFRKGESVKDSDIDLFIETATKKVIDLSKFEKKLKHKINIIDEPDIKKIPLRLKNNIINGIKLSGFFKT
jgi:predicted nucleotidyltransferase